MPLVDVTRGEDKPVHIDEHHDDDDHDHVSPALPASDSVTCLLPPFVLVLHAILVPIVCFRTRTKTENLSGQPVAMTRITATMSWASLLPKLAPVPRRLRHCQLRQPAPAYIRAQHRRRRFCTAWHRRTWLRYMISL
jgi:hypothetical protein